MRPERYPRADALTADFYRLLAAGAIEPTDAERARVMAARRELVRDSLFANERDWWLSPADNGRAETVSDFALRRECYLDRVAAARLGSAPGNQRDTAEHGAAFERERRLLKYFPVMYVSAPHIESNVTGTFPGIPTPLLYATAVLDRHLAIDEFPCLRTPQVVAVLNPPVYSDVFERELDECLARYGPRVVGISNLSESHYFALRIAERVKRANPATIVMLGGSHEDGTNPVVYRRAAERAERRGHSGVRGVPTTLASLSALSEEQLQRCERLQTLVTEAERQSIDFVAAGDGPYLVMTLMRIVADNLDASCAQLKDIVASLHADFEAAEGSADLFFCRGDAGPIEHVSLSGRALDRTALPFIHLRRLTHENRFPVFAQKKTAQVMACVGCKYACAFCFESADQMLYQVPKMQPRTAANVAKELDVRQEEGFEAVFFDDSTFTQNRVQVNELLTQILRRRQHGPYLEWGCQTTIADVEPALLQRMAAAGCTYIYFGLEAATPSESRLQKARQLKAVSGDTDWAERFRRVAGWCRDSGIRVGTSLQFGLDESLDDQIETLRLVSELYRDGLVAKQSVALNINTPYPGSEQWIALLLRDQGSLPDYRQRLQRHPGFETAHQFAVLSRSAADQLYELSVDALGDAIVGVSIAATLDRKE